MYSSNLFVIQEILCRICFSTQIQSVWCTGRRGSGELFSPLSPTPTCHCGPEQPRVQTLELGYLLVRLLVRSHRSLVRLLCTTHFAHMLRCAHSRARGTVIDLMAIYSVFFSILDHRGMETIDAIEIWLRKSCKRGGKMHFATFSLKREYRLRKKDIKWYELNQCPLTELKSLDFPV